jgi:hypothetical protein
MALCSVVLFLELKTPKSLISQKKMLKRQGEAQTQHPLEKKIL